MDPLEGTAWSEAGTVAGFAQSPPNSTLMRFAAVERSTGKTGLLDIGCGAGRNAVPLARQEWTVTGLDLSWPMLQAAAARAQDEGTTQALQLALAPMEQLPIRTADELRVADVESTIEVRTGTATDEIVKAAIDYGADLIVMGTQGRRALQHC